MKEFTIDVEIAASQKRVWDALVDLENYGKWNPIIPFGQGKFEANSYLQLTLMRTKDKGIKFRPKRLKASKIAENLFYRSRLCILN